MRTADFSTMMSSNKAHFYDTKFIFESHNTGKEDWLMNNYFKYDEILRFIIH